ncbi:5-formyltetrahydrofolate cyclo-ligase-like [Ovis aries]|uniref:5-formyltetrahydrofolate cyclo-ligase-like n=1 Tax=Ovis aries TaxID=9940 RepID=UPI0029528F4B|nr:5-formyltetrahydrofolate cyclo-ligase-like [Ovis aries]
MGGSQLEYFSPKLSVDGRLRQLTTGSTREISNKFFHITHIIGEDEVLEEALSTGGLDLIFVPGLGFDKQSNRLGWGKGYYDTYLKRCLQSQDVKPYTLALAFKEQICLQVPVDENDVRVDEVLYEDS